MRETIIIIAIILIILGGDIWTKKYLDKTSAEIVEQLKNLKEKTQSAKISGDRTEIKEKLKEIESKWEGINETWSIIAVHQELDNIEQAFTKAKSNINDGNLETALQEIETTIFFVEHVNEREKLNLKNIF